MYQIKYKDNYTQKAREFLKQNPSLIESYKNIITILEENPFEPSLALQNLYRDLRELYFVDITVEFRMVLYVEKFGKSVYLIDIGRAKS